MPGAQSVRRLRHLRREMRRREAELGTRPEQRRALLRDELQRRVVVVHRRMQRAVDRDRVLVLQHAESVVQFGLRDVEIGAGQRGGCLAEVRTRAAPIETVLVTDRSGVAAQQRGERRRELLDARGRIAQQLDGGPGPPGRQRVRRMRRQHEGRDEWAHALARQRRRLVRIAGYVANDADQRRKLCRQSLGDARRVDRRGPQHISVVERDRIVVDEDRVCGEQLARVDEPMRAHRRRPHRGELAGQQRCDGLLEEGIVVIGNEHESRRERKRPQRLRHHRPPSSRAGAVCAAPRAARPRP